MLVKRSLFICLAISSAVVSHASYELLLAVDQGMDRVHRFDPVTGLSLGSFGEGMMVNPTKIALDRSAGIAYVTNFSLQSVQKWNYSTGEYLGDLVNSLGNAYGIARLNNGNIAVANGALVQVYNPAGGFLNSFATTGFGLGTDGANLFVGEFGQIRKFKENGTLLGTVTTSLANDDINVRGETAYTGGGGYGNTFGRFNPQSMTGFTQFTVGNLANTGNVEATALSHGAFLYVPGRATDDITRGVFSRYHTTAGFGVSTFGNLPNTSRITGMEIVLAPEPGSLAVFGLGLIALMRKRR